MALEDIDKLKRNNQELQEIINNSWDGIGIIDYSTKFIYVNNAFMPILGFPKDEILKKQFVSLMEEKYRKPFTKLLVDDFSEKKYKAEIDVACIRKDSKIVYLKITISSMLNKKLFVINTKDITAEISDSEILNDYVISMHTDLHGLITKVSSAFLKLSLYSKKDIIGKHYSFLAHKDTKKIVYDNISKSLKNQQEWSGKLKNTKKDGSAFWINMKMKPVFNKYGDITGYTSLMFDLTNEINLNDEASLLQEQVEKAKSDIEQKNNLLVHQSKLAIMTETLQMLSHEWRQPLNLISIQAQKLELDYTLENNPSISRTIDVLENIKNEANNLSSTIEKFQKFLKPNSDKTITKPSIVINDAVKIFKTKYKDADIDVEIEINDDIEFETLFNELTTVFINLLDNAKEATKGNGFIQIKEFVENDSLLFEVIDDGVGIDSEIIHKVFEPYFSTKNKKHGVGLGLYTSRIIVNMHLNGIITVENRDNQTVFKISLPLEN